ncbi:[protein-PII] uridylyltransferase [Limobrevibacterium gyesilva]|uniref:Bifunctional uridylyltransferase/uridylyl-removing enzyme n=1 Tax=Limobrevibacterium gyesilva TaxID=2991712 RepID=A0AA42CDX4_9PROT|nr:[protein-PII] uridylyltransferase [Limobrevibacterium gyesilva]MCW3474484.1 [protein-PII] uridylyltransferase [Limobrevibacterium gyesilva]
MLPPAPLPAIPADATALLRDALGTLVCGPTSGDDGPIPRDAALAVFRRHLARIQSHVRDTFEQGGLSGLQAARLLASLTDGLIQELHIYASAVHGVVPDASGATPAALGRLTVAATGGYGRGVLAPFSDIDLLFLTAAQPTPIALRVVEFTLYFLWDLGLKVGHATRSVADCLTEANGDATVRTSMLDARHVAGDASLFGDFATRFRQACTEAGAAGYIAAKQAERDTRHRRYGDSPYVVEPNIKEGRGGLRDLQTLYWMARYVFGTRTMAELADPHGPAGGIITETEARLARRSWDFLWSLRFHLHYVAGRAEERLTFDLQPVVGARMGYTRHGRQDGVERFMRHYFLTAREVTRLSHVLEPALERAALGPPAKASETDAALAKAGFVLADGQLMPATAQLFHDEPIRMLRLLQVARDRNLKLHPLAMRALIRNERRAVLLRDNPEAAALFLDLLCGRDAEHNRADGARWLTILNETGLLGRLLPDWARIVGQMQFDTYHVFTVDEHTIEAVRILNTLERGDLAEIAPVASGLVDHLQSRRALYVAMLLHDIAKGRGGDHSELGAELALDVGPALGLSAEETEMVSWLVLHHLLLNQTAFKRDIDDPKTILDLAEVIQSPERLRLLLVLTVADMRAVSSKVWNGWKATLLRELYARVAEVLAGGLSTTERDVRVARAREAVAMLLAEWPKEDIDHFLALGYPGYWLSFDPETHVRHARMIRDAEARHAPLTVETQPLPARAVTEVTVYAADHAGLFSRIAGALAVAGASIVDARIHTLTNGMALDTFWIQDAAGGAFDAPHRLARLYVLIEQALSGRIRLASEIRKVSRALLGRRMRAIHVPPRVVIDNHASNTYTVLEVNGRDRPGLLHDVTAAISDQGLQIASAHVTTYGVRAVDVFYVKDVFGLKVENERKLAQLREALLAALASPDEAAPTPVPTPAKRRRAVGAS